jgi:hypothetical protein
MRSKSVCYLIAATLVASGCHTMKSLTWSELEGLRPNRAWVTHEDERVSEVSGPQVYGDTLVGYMDGAFREVPTASIKQVVVKRPARAKTIGLIAAGTAVATAVGVWISGLGEKDPMDDVNCNDYDPGEHPLCP